MFQPIPAIILAGGLGTRLRTVINDMPKPMAPVNGKPFLHYIFVYLQKEGVKEAILSVGYKSEMIEEYFGYNYMDISIRYAVEAEPLGTGGGIRQAMDVASSDAFVLNGDTFFDVDLEDLQYFYEQKKSDLGLSLKRMERFDRYGTVALDSTGRVRQFNEKKYCDEGLVNGGVYLLSQELFKKIEAIEGQPLPQKFSFEKDVMEKHLGSLAFHGHTFDGYFIDIGIPEDYQKAQSDFK